MIENKEEVTQKVPMYIYWDKEQVKEFVGWTANSTLYRAMKVSHFPKPFKLVRSSRWRKDEVIEWMNNLPRAELGGDDYGKGH